jgi:hypothetical protein
VSDFSAAFEELLAGLDRLEIAFFVGGSVASGVHGIPRNTKDIDVVADISLDIVSEFCAVLAPRFYADAEQAVFAIGAGRAFNVIHLKSAHKFDIFPAGKDRFIRSQLARRRYSTTSVAGLENIEFPVASAEDTILAKLVWFRKGGEVSDQQWNDILGVIHVQAGRLDLGYLQEWAGELGVVDLLRKALDGGATSRRQ